jgi:hypothetical protein
MYDEDQTLNFSREVSFLHRGNEMQCALDEYGNYLGPPHTSHAYVDSLAVLKRLGETTGGTLKNLTVSLRDNSAAIDPTILNPFTSLTYLDWWISRTNPHSPTLVLALDFLL